MKHVLVDLPFAYAARGTRQRKRTVECFGLVGFVPVRIPVLEPSEAPLFKVKVAGSYDEPVKGVVHDGTAYCDVADPGPFGRAKGIGDPAFFREAKDRLHELPLGSLRAVLRVVQGTASDVAMIERMDGEIPATVVESGEAAAAARAVADAAGLVFHRGRLASSHLEPVLFKTNFRAAQGTPSEVALLDLRAWYDWVDPGRDRLSLGYAANQPWNYFVANIEPQGVPEGIVWRCRDAELHLARAWSIIGDGAGHSWGRMRNHLEPMLDLLELARERSLTPDEIAAGVRHVYGACAAIQTIHGENSCELAGARNYADVAAEIGKYRARLLEPEQEARIGMRA